MPATGDAEPGFLRPTWKRFGIAPWALALTVLAVLASVRFYGVFGPPQVRILFLVQAVAMWLLPAIFLTGEGRQAIGLRVPRRGVGIIALCGPIGVIIGLALFAVSMRAFGSGADSWISSVRAGMQLEQMRRAMGTAGILAVLAVPALVVTPVGEEILFRGLIQQAFAMRWNRIVGMAVNSLAFGLVHLHVHGLWRDAAGFHLRVGSGVLFVLSGAMISVLFTFCRERTGSLFGAMAAHAGCNAAVIFPLVLMRAG
jgi:uncharacterized protein